MDPTITDLTARAGEEVRPLPFLPTFYISRTGRVFHVTALRGVTEIATIVRKKGRRVANLVGPWGQKTIAVARLVALVFIGSPPDSARTFVCHRDDDPTNDAPENLYWGDAKSNMEDRLRNGVEARGFTEATAREAIKMSQDGATVGQIARRFGVADLCVTNLLSGRTWLHLDGDRRVNPLISRQAVAISLAALGFSARDISILTGVKIKSIHEMLSRARRLGRLDRAA